MLILLIVLIRETFTYFNDKIIFKTFYFFHVKRFSDVDHLIQQVGGVIYWS